MITLSHEECPQGGERWVAERLGRPSASQFHRLISVKTLKPKTTAADTYLNELLSEWMTGEPVTFEARGFALRGREMEDEAVAWYECEKRVDTERVGLILNNARTVLSSPDRLVGKNGGLETKCPSAKVHVANLLGGTDDYFAQCQGALWLSEREWWDCLSYCPGMPDASMRYGRNEPFIRALSEALAAFCANLESKRARLLAMGAVPANHTEAE